MYFHHLHFYVEDAAIWKDWFVQKLGFQQLHRRETADAIKLIQDGIEIWISAPEQSDEVKNYLKQHPPGLADIAFATNRFDEILTQARKQNALLSTFVLHPQKHPNSSRQNDSSILSRAAFNRCCQIKGWAHIRHTLIEVDTEWIEQQQLRQQQMAASGQQHWLSLIDHAVINVPKGQLQAAVDWYQTLFNLQRGQSFEINTAHSGLYSQVLVHPEGTVQIPINEPSSDNSQIQEFLEHNRGAGVQHVALRSANAVDAIAHFRHQGLNLLSVPHTYYADLQQRPNCPLKDLSAISQQQLLIDWHNEGKQGTLLQTFTEPIFAEPTFFFEIIERGQYKESGQVKTAQGFGEGNFQALFEAIERAQVERGSLEQ